MQISSAQCAECRKPINYRKKNSNTIILVAAADEF